MTHLMRTITGTLVLFMGLLVVGCASPSDDDLYRAWRDRDPEQWQLADGGATHSRSTLRSRLAAPDNESKPADTTDILHGVGGYVRLALQRNPAIHAAQRRVERLGARVPQVTSLDDPMFQMAPFGEMAETAAGQVGLMTVVSQKLPFPGKLDTRGRIAEQDAAMALADLQQTRLTVVADTRRAYWSFYFTTHALHTMRKSRSLLLDLKQIAESEYKAGKRSQTDVLRASVELSNLDNELIVLGQHQATARSMLNQLLDRPVDSALPEPKAAQADTIDADLDELLADAARHNPSIARAHERIEQFRQHQKLARLNRWPDLTVSVTYNVVEDQGMAMSANGKDQWWFGFGVNLPIWTEKYQAAEREALQGMLEGVAQLTTEQNRIAFQVQDAYLRVKAQQKLIELFKDVIIPKTRQTMDASSSGYRVGSVDFLTLVDNWRKLLNFELMYHRALADMEQAVADLERAVGRSVNRTGSPDSEDRPMSNPTTESAQPRAEDTPHE